MVYVKSTDCDCLHGTYIKESKLKFQNFKNCRFLLAGVYCITQYTLTT